MKTHLVWSDVVLWMLLFGCHMDGDVAFMNNHVDVIFIFPVKLLIIIFPLWGVERKGWHK